MPDYGANDGALLLPVSHAHHRDLRPLLASLGAEIDSADHATRERGIWLADREVDARPGSYSYTDPPPWRNALTGVQVHATLRVPGEAEQVIGRFLRSGLPAAHLLHHAIDQDVEVLLCRRRAGDGWLWRAVVRCGDEFTIIDWCYGVPMLVRWNLDRERHFEVEFSPNGAAVQSFSPGAATDSPSAGVR